MQKEGNQEAYKLRCKDIKYKVNKEKDTVTALETVVVPSPFSFFSHWPTYFSTIGVAKVSKEAEEEFIVFIIKTLPRSYHFIILIKPYPFTKFLPFTIFISFCFIKSRISHNIYI